jgi:hypothetical protein
MAKKIKSFSLGRARHKWVSVQHKDVLLGTLSKQQRGGDFEGAKEMRYTTKGSRFRRASEEKIASVQRSFEKARRGKSLFGLEDAE